MKKSILASMSFVVRLAGATAVALLASCTVGGVAEPDTEQVGEARSASVTLWNTYSTSSTENTTGLSMLSGYPNCVLSGVLGNFNKGQSSQWDVESLFSEAGPDPSTMHLLAHGGAYTDINNDRDWADNTVGAKAMCFDTQVTESATSYWGGDGESYSPQWIISAASNRQCWLQSLEASDGDFGSTSDYVRVKKYTTTDTQHPTLGWYIEGNLGGNIGYSGPPGFTAVCYDLPGTSLEIDSYSVTSTSGNHASTETYANYTAACGLTSVRGPFTSNSTSTGVYVEIDSATGFWTLHAYGGQTGVAACVDWE